MQRLKTKKAKYLDNVTTTHILCYPTCLILSFRLSKCIMRVFPKNDYISTNICQKGKSFNI